MRDTYSGERIGSGKFQVASLLIATLLLTALSAAAEAQLSGTEILYAGGNGEVLLEHLKTIAVPRWILTFAAMCAAVLLLALSGIGDSRKRAASAAHEGPQLPDGLRSIAVLGKTYTLEVFTGKVKDITVAFDTQTDDVIVVGGTTARTTHWQMPWSRHRRQPLPSGIEKNLVTLGYSDNLREIWQFSGGQLNVVPGNLISFVVRHDSENYAECLIAYNHDNAQFDVFDFSSAHAITRLPAWFVATMVGTAGAVWGWNSAVASFSNEVAPGASVGLMGLAVWLIALCVAAVVALVPFILATILIPGLRTMIFKKRYRPWLKQWLETSTPDAKRIFPIEWVPQPRTATADLFYKPM